MPVPSRDYGVNQRLPANSMIRGSLRKESKAEERTQQSADHAKLNADGLKMRSKPEQAMFNESQTTTSQTRSSGFPVKTTSARLASTDTSRGRLIRENTNKAVVRTSNADQNGQSTSAVPIASTRQATGSARTVPTLMNKSGKTTNGNSLRMPTQISSAMRPAARKGQETSKNNTSSTPATRTPEVADTGSDLLQDEFLQLNLLHYQSVPVLNAYKRSIARDIERRTQQLIHQQDITQRLEADIQCMQSLSALRLWLDEIKSHSDAQQIQSLSQVVHDIVQCCDESGMIHPLKEFEIWLEESLSVLQRRQSVDNSSDDISFIQPLAGEWHQRMKELRTSMSISRTTLQQLGVILDNSGIATMISLCQKLVNAFIQELETGMVLEETIMQCETEWREMQLEQALQQLSTSSQSRSCDLNATKGLWSQ